MKILCIKDHVRSSINDFRERNRVITNPSFAVHNFPRITVAVYFTEFESIEALAEHVVREHWGSACNIVLMLCIGTSINTWIDIPLYTSDCVREVLYIGTLIITIIIIITIIVILLIIINNSDLSL